MRVLALVSLGFLCITCWSNAAHGAPFRNLNFEEGVFSHPDGGPIDEVLPGWRARHVSGEISDVLRNGIGGFVFSLSIHNRETQWFPSGTLPLEGEYSVVLESGRWIPGFPDESPVEIWQTGTVPNDAKSLRFLTRLGHGPDVSLSSFVVPQNDGVVMVIANISRFAGQEFTLSFRSDDGKYFAFIDDIEFSPLPVPEPATWGLLTLSAAAIPFLRRRHRRDDTQSPTSG